MIVLFIESYGAVALDDRRLAPELADEMRAFADATAAAGWHVASARVEAPTAGGGSWLSHATLLSQQWIDGPRRLCAICRAVAERADGEFRPRGISLGRCVSGDQARLARG